MGRNRIDLPFGLPPGDADLIKGIATLDTNLMGATPSVLILYAPAAGAVWQGVVHSRR